MDTNAGDLSLELRLSDGSAYPRKGRLYSADRQISATTGTMQIVAVFPNPDAVLRPGQYAQVRTMTRLQTNVFLLPQRAIQEVQGAYQVAVVTAEGNGATNVAHLRHIKVGRQIGPNWIVEEGLKPGDSVVVEGGLKVLRDGATVTPERMEAAGTNSGATNSSH